MNPRGRPEKLTNGMKIWIANQWIANHQKGQKGEAKAPALQANIRSIMENAFRREAEDQGHDWTEEFIRKTVDGLLPGLSAIQKFVRPFNRKLGEPAPLDNPWHLGLLREYPQVSAEAAQHINKVQQALTVSVLPVNPDSYHITVRQALWVARLYDIVRKHVETDEPGERFKNTDPHYPSVLLSVAFHYANYELLCDLSSIPCDTLELDDAFSHGLQQFYDFVAKQNAQPLREGEIIWIRREKIRLRL